MAQYQLCCKPCWVAWTTQIRALSGTKAKPGDVLSFPPTQSQVEAAKATTHDEQLRAEARAQADNQLGTQAVLAGAKDQLPPREAERKPPSSEAERPRLRQVPPPSYPVTLETGRIYFFYRPKPDVMHPHNLETIQRFDILLEVMHRPRSTALPASASAAVSPEAHLPNPAEPPATETPSGTGAGEEGDRAGGPRGGAGALKGRDEGEAGAVGSVTGVLGEGIGGYGEPKAQGLPKTAGEVAMQRVFGEQQQQKPNPPRVGAQARAMKDVTEEIEPGSLVRQITVSKKHLPSVYTHERFFAYISAVGRSVSDLVSREEQYYTERNLLRVHPAERVAGCGTYCIYTYRTQPGVESRGPSSTRLAYVLELPLAPEAGECQQDLGLEQKGVLAIAVKNPQYRGDDAGPPFGPAISRNPHYTAEQMASFKGQRWGSCEDLSLLDAEGAELLLVGARHEPPRGNMDDAIKHVSYQTLIKHRQDLSAAGAAPGTEQATTQAAITDATGSTVVASYKDLLINLLRKTVGDSPKPPQHTLAVPSADVPAGGGKGAITAVGSGTSIVTTDSAGSVRITDVPLVPAGALTEAVRAERERQGQATQDYDLHLVQQQQQQQQGPEGDPIPTFPAETGKWL